jgi:eukaryotic-like serine/threonine-protein kinase
MQRTQLGKYRIVAKIGQGAMGEVYKAHDPVLNRFVAIKTIATSLGSDEQFRKRFEQEAKSAAKLNHRNIVTVYEFSQEQDLIYLVMELLEGTDLKDVISRRALPRLEDKLAVIEQICDGLAYAHTKGVVHRDLKPANIHLLPSGTVKVMDFGLARLDKSDMTKTGTVMGTPNYMSPEQVRGERVDRRSDVFSVGAVMYEFLAGHKPFESETMHTILFQVLDHDPEPIRKWVPDMPLPVVQLIQKALVKEPDWRYQSATELREALRSARRAMAASRMAAAALGAPDDAEATLLGTEAPTFISNPDASPDLRAAATQTRLGSAARERTLVTGATALDLSGEAAADDEPPTERPDPTFVGDAYPREASALPVWLYAVAIVLVGVLLVAGAIWWQTRPAPGPPPGDLAKQREMLQDILITSQIELARNHLDNKEYQAAVDQARKALDIDKTNADASEILKQAQGRLAEVDGAAKAATAAYQKGDTATASRELNRLLEIDAQNAVASDLVPKLNQYFRQQAEGARAAATKARADAEPARRGAAEAYAVAERRSREAEALLQKEQFAEATQRFVEAGDLFGRARREAAEAAAAAVPPPRPAAAVVTTVPSAPPPPTASAVPPPSANPSAPAPNASGSSTSVPRTPGPSASASQAPPSQAPPNGAPPTVLTAPPSLPAAAASLPGPAGADQAVRRVLADYGRALETHDLSLFKSLKPDLSGEEEKRLQESFKAIRSHQVGIVVQSVQIDGGQATVRVARHDVVNGKPMKEQQQTFRLVQRGATWTIVSIGQ